jgi:hypothetical protein
MTKPSKAALQEEQTLKSFLTVENVVEQTYSYIHGVMNTFNPQVSLWGSIMVHELRAIPDFYASPLIMKYYTESVVLHIINAVLRARPRLSSQAADRCYRNSQGTQNEAVKILTARFSKDQPAVTLIREHELNEVYLAWERRSPHLTAMYTR